MVRRSQVKSSVSSPLPKASRISSHPSSNGLAERAVQSFKEGMKRMQHAPLQLCLTRWLASYRLTPHSTTNRSPAEMLLCQRPKWRLDFICTSTRYRLEGKQMKQTQQHDQHAKDGTFNRGDDVVVRNFVPGPTWLPGKLLQRTGPVSFTAQLSDGRVVIRIIF